MSGLANALLLLHTQDFQVVSPHKNIIVFTMHALSSKANFDPPALLFSGNVTPAKLVGRAKNTLHIEVNFWQ